MCTTLSTDRNASLTEPTRPQAPVSNMGWESESRRDSPVVLLCLGTAGPQLVAANAHTSAASECTQLLPAVIGNLLPANIDFLLEAQTYTSLLRNGDRGYMRSVRRQFRLHWIRAMRPQGCLLTLCEQTPFCHGGHKVHDLQAGQPSGLLHQIYGRLYRGAGTGPVC